MTEWSIQAFRMTAWSIQAFRMTAYRKWECRTTDSDSCNLVKHSCRRGSDNLEKGTSVNNIRSCHRALHKHRSGKHNRRPAWGNNKYLALDMYNRCRESGNYKLVRCR